LELPSLVDSNFSQPKRHRISISSPNALVKNTPGLEQHKNGSAYLLDGILKADRSTGVATMVMQRSSAPAEFATPDWFDHDKRYIVQRMQEIAFSPKRLLVVIDPSATLREEAAAIREVITDLPANIKPTVLIATNRNSKDSQERPLGSVSETLSDITPE